MPLPPLAAAPVVAPSPIVTHRTCRACATPVPCATAEAHAAVTLVPRMDLGLVAPVAFPDAASGGSRPAVPLDLRQCPKCSLVQLAHTIPPDWRYQEYWYRSGTNDAMVAELQDVVGALRARGVGAATDVVVDVGANDGTLLRAWADPVGEDRPVPYRVAFEPAPNLYRHLAPHAETVYQTLYPPPDAQIAGIYRGRVKALTAIAMAYAVDDPHGFFSEIAAWLHPDGWAVVQLQDLASVVEGRQLDYVCHEHLTAWSLGALTQVLLSTDLRVVDVENRTVNGGSLRVYLRHRAKLKSTTPLAEAGRERIAKQIDRETQLGIGVLVSERTHQQTWAAFRADVETIQTLVGAWVESQRVGGGTVDLYGASTKSLTLLAVCGLDARVLRQAWERSPQKVGRYVGGTGIPIVSEARGRSDPPRALLAGIWQFREGVITRERDYLAAGGRILFPLPWPEVVWMVDGVVVAERLEGMGV